jgi:AraC family transcriptional regulator
LTGAATRQSRRASSDSMPAFAAGVFLGSACQTVQTASFQLAELQATVPEREVPRHRHETPHFVLVLRGIYLTEARNQDGPCSSSTLIYNPAGTTHRDCFRSRNGRFLSITPSLNGSRLLDRDSSVARVVAGESVRSLEGGLITRAIEREFQREKHPSSLVLEGLGLELIGQLIRPEERIESRRIPDWLLRTKEIIEDCAGSEITIADLAATVAVHPVYLARAFRKYFGNSPGEYVRRNRLLRVRRLLIDTRLPLVEVALQCGFSDQSRMTHAFTSEFGIAPGRYRRQRWQ